MWIAYWETVILLNLKSNILFEPLIYIMGIWTMKLDWYHVDWIKNSLLMSYHYNEYNELKAGKTYHFWSSNDIIKSKPWLHLLVYRATVTYLLSNNVYFFKIRNIITSITNESNWLQVLLIIMSISSAIVYSSVRLSTGKCLCSVQCDNSAVFKPCKWKLKYLSELQYTV